MNSYYIRSRGRVTGPFDEMVLRRMIARGHVTRVHELSPDGIQWAVATEYPQFAWSIAGPTKSSSPESGSTLAQPSRETGHSSVSGRSNLPPLPSPHEFRPAKSGLQWQRGLLAGGCLGVCLLSFFVIRWIWPSTPAVASEEELYAKLKSSVGRVVVGVKGTIKSQYREGSLVVGTAFLVSERGYYLTNRHVIESAIPYQQDAALARRESAALSAEHGVPIELQNHIWLLIEDQKYDCELVYSSDIYDLAVLRAKAVPGAQALPISSKATHTPLSLVYAAGYPAVNDMALTKEAERKKMVNAKTTDVKSQFSKQALTLQVNSGSINLTFTGDQKIQTIKHQAVVNPGNSGGPLVNTVGVVIGINTSVTRITEPDDATFEAASYAPIIAQMRSEIDEHVPGVGWQD